MNQELSNTHSGLGILPLELQWKISELLDFQSARRVTATCRFFRSSPRSPLSFQSKADRDGFLYDAEYFLQHVIDQSFACFHCSTIKPRHAFSEDQVTRNNSKCRAPIGARFCMDCGERKRLYTPGQRIVKTDGASYNMCRLCSELKMGLYCTFCKQCRWCLQAAYGKWENGCPAPHCRLRDAEERERLKDLRTTFEDVLPFPGAQKHRSHHHTSPTLRSMDQEAHDSRIALQNLPVELQWKIFELLDFPSALLLLATCRALHFSPRSPVSFQSIADKNAFLADAEHFDQHWQWDKNYACYHCSSMKPKEQFSKSQSQGLYNRYRARGTSRFCLDCGVASEYYLPGHKVRSRGGGRRLIIESGTCPALTSGWFCAACKMDEDCLVTQYGARFDLCPNPACMSLGNQEYRKMMGLQVVFEENLPLFTVDEAFDDTFTRQRPPRIEPLYYDWFAQWCMTHETRWYRSRCYLQRNLIGLQLVA